MQFVLQRSFVRTFIFQIKLLSNSANSPVLVIITTALAIRKQMTWVPLDAPHTPSACQQFKHTQLILIKIQCTEDVFILYQVNYISSGA